MNVTERVAADVRPWRERVAVGVRAWDLPAILVLSVATYAGLLVRLAHVLPAGFPLNDGGLFYVMVKDVQHADYTLPARTSYNGGDIPFAYPPLPFYLAAFLDDLGPWSLLDVFRFFPLAVSTLTIPAFFLLCRAMLPSRFMALIAVFAFALLPRSFNWEISGGGLTRAPGFLLAILALHQGYLLYTRGQRRFVVSSAMLAVLAILSHPEMGWFVAFSFAVFLVAYGRNVRAIRHSILVAVGALAMTAPWWATVIARHGLSPPLSAAQAGGQSWYSWARLALFDFTEEPFLPLLAALGLVGVLACLADRKFLLPAWLAVMFILDPRKASTYAMVPLAMLVAIGIAGVVLPRLSKGAGDQPQDSSWLPVQFRRPLPQLALVFFLLYAVFSAIGAGVNGPSPLHALSADHREAMRWVAANTPEDSRFLVVTSWREPWTDATSEWFPALARRVSVATVQGYEWLGKGEYDGQKARYEDLQDCADEAAACPEDWAAETATAFTHVYLPKKMDAFDFYKEDEDCCPALRNSLRSSPEYDVVYDGPGATIFARRSAQ